MSLHQKHMLLASCAHGSDQARVAAEKSRLREPTENGKAGEYSNMIHDGFYLDTPKRLLAITYNASDVLLTKMKPEPKYKGKFHHLQVCRTELRPSSILLVLKQSTPIPFSSKKDR